ncbi:MAG: hypothetical protein KIT57_18970, partial [Blastocatellales bacterium]|nr:hypothetical protein [Blastocatellales bacterium]
GSYERDNETGLDFAQARYYANVQGRFTSVDPDNAGAFESDPQSWNGYAYARNNPLLYVDPDGLKFKICYNGDCHEYSDRQFWDSKKTLQNSGFTVKSGKIFNSEGEQIGTYTRTSFDDLSPGANLFIGEMQRRAPALQQAIAVVAVVNLAVPAAIITADSFLGTAVGRYAYSVTRVGLRRVENLSRMSRDKARKILEEAGFKRKPNSPRGYEKYKNPNGDEVYIKPDGTVDRVPSQETLRELGKSGKGWRLDPEGNPVRPHTFPSEVVR